MSATVEGVFRVIDRASAPMRRMEQQAKRTDRAINDLGRNLDTVGDRSQVRQLAQTERALANVGRETRVLERDTNRSRRAVQGMRRDVGGLGDAVIRLGAIFGGIGRLAMPAMFLGILAAIKPLIAAVGALAGGVVALIPKLTDLAGVAAVLPATFTGIGLAVGVAKLAFKDFSEAMGGNKKALERLTPEARSFMRTLKQYSPVMADLRKEAQRGLFPGLELSVRRLQRGVPTLRRLIRGMSREMGSQAGQWASFLTTGPNLRDFRTIGEQGTQIFSRMSRGARNLTAALIDITVAARPFTDWLTTSLLRGTRNFRNFIQQSRESGRLARYFERVRDSVKRFWSILGNLFRTFRGIGRAGRDLGDDLWESFDRITRGWDRWVNSVEGQTRLRAWFDGLRPTLRELALLTGDLTRGFFNMTGPASQRQTAGMIGQLRQWGPVLRDILNSATAAFGPAMLDMLRELGRTLAILLQGGGAITMFLRAITGILRVVNGLLEAVPGLGRILTGVFTVVGVNMLLSRLRIFGSTVSNLAAKWWGVSAAANSAAAAEARAMSASGVGPGIVPLGRGRGGGGAGTRDPGTGAILMGPAGGGLRDRPGAWTRFREGRAGARAAAPAGLWGGTNPLTGLLAGAGAATGVSALRTRTAAAGGAGALLRGGAGKALRGAAKFALPASAALAALDFATFQGSMAERGRAALSGATFGLISRPKTRSEQREAGFARAEEYAGRLNQDATLTGSRARKGALEREIAQSRQGDPRNEAKRSALVEYLKRENANIRVLMRERRNIMEGESRRKGAGLSEEFEKAFGIRARGQGGPQHAMRKMVSGVVDQMRTMKGAGAKVLAQNNLAFAREQAKGNPKLLREVKRLEDGIVSRFSRMGNKAQIVNGRIRTGSQREWERIRAAMSGKAEQARQEVSAAFTAIQNAAAGSLRAMGYSPAEARALVQAAEKGQGAVNKVQAGAAAVRNDTVTSNLMPSGGGDGWGRRMPRTGEGVGQRNEPRSMASRAATTGAGLMGAKSGMGVYASDASRFGLRVSSGLRAGAVTRSGNRSYHSSGDALDLAGSPAAMMAFAQHAASAYGGQLEELIYSPMGFSIKNGQRVAPYAVSDHYDHVHIADAQGGGALTGGGAAGAFGPMQIAALQAPTSRLGGAPGAMANAATRGYAAALTAQINANMGGGGPGAVAGGGPYTAQTAAALWTQAGGNPGLARLMGAIAMAESTGRPGVTNSIGARGLWQVMPGTARHFGFDYNRLTDPLYNARAAVRIHQGQGLGAWEAYTRGMHRQYMGDGMGRVSLGGSPSRTPTPTKRSGMRGQMNVTINIHGGNGNTQAEVERALMRVAQELDLALVGEED